MNSSMDPTGISTGNAGIVIIHRIPIGLSSLFVIPYTGNYFLLIDTGAVHTIIDKTFALEQLRIKPAGIPQPVFTPGGERLKVQQIDFEFLGITSKCLCGSIAPWLAKFSSHTIGILGNDILVRHHAVIDLRFRQIQFSIK